MTSLFYYKDQTCPVCGRIFAQTRVRSSLCIVERRDSDYRVQYRNCNPNWYAVMVCPTCNYAAPRSFFGDLSDEEREASRPILGQFPLKDLTGERTLLEVAECYERAVQCAQVRKLKPSILGNLYMQTAWAYWEINEKVKEQEFLNLALEAYLEAYNYERVPANRMSLGDLVYLIGELNRRTERYEEAVIWFSKVAEMQDVRPGTIRLAREMWQLARDAYRRGPAEHSLEEVCSPERTEVGTSKQEVVPMAETPEPERRRVKTFVRTQLYQDQVEWLEKVGRWWSSESELEASSVLRVLLELVQDLPLQQLQVADEDELKKALAEHITASAGGDLFAIQEG